jgi:hypothetical protein
VAFTGPFSIIGQLVGQHFVHMGINTGLGSDSPTLQVVSLSSFLWSYKMLHPSPLCPMTHEVPTVGTLGGKEA